MKIKAWIVYIIGLHLIIATVFLFPNQVNKIYEKVGILDHSSGHDYYIDFLWNSYSNRSKTLKQESNQLVFFGNSLTNGLCVESLFNGVNMGVSGETIRNAKEKIGSIQNLENKRIVISFGINDIPANTREIMKDYEEFISYLPESSTIYLSSVLPLNEDAFNEKIKDQKTNWQIKELNEEIEKFCIDKPNVFFVNASKYLSDSSGELSNEFHLGDGLHLNEHGNLLWAKGLFEGIQKTSKEYFITKAEN